MSNLAFIDGQNLNYGTKALYNKIGGEMMDFLDRADMRDLIEYRKEKAPKALTPVGSFSLGIYSIILVYSLKSNTLPYYEIRNLYRKNPGGGSAAGY